MTVGILAIQGDYEAHGRMLAKLGAKVRFVRKPEHLDQVDALIIPGGESTTFLNFLAEQGFLEKLRAFVRAKPTFGTCAGAILLAKNVVNPSQESLGAIDLAVERNAYGRQNESFIAEVESKFGPLELVFIRAPKITRVGPSVEVLASEKNDPVLVREGNVMAATFHPELSSSTRVHEEFLKMARNGAK
jgi:5'-phosphate synthase pdxT subunit